MNFALPLAILVSSTCCSLSSSFSFLGAPVQQRGFLAPRPSQQQQQQEVVVLYSRTTNDGSAEDDDDAALSKAVDLKADMTSSSTEIAHLQKKLRYWKKQEVAKVLEHKKYIQKQVIRQKLKPIYVREGKIDKYTLRPIYDQETDRIKTEVWTIKERIKLTHAKLKEEERVQRVREETAAHWLEFRQKAKVLTGQLEDARAEQERIRDKATSRLDSLKSEYSESIGSMQEQSTKRLSEKEQEIDGLAEEIHGLIDQLQTKRQELQTKDSVVASLEHDVEEKEAVVASLESEVEQKEVTLDMLSRERASLRALVKQSWKVLTSRMRKKRPSFGRKQQSTQADAPAGEKIDEEVEIHARETNDAGKKETEKERESEKEPVLA